MVRDNVISFDQSTTGTRRRVADAKVHELVGTCRSQVADTLPRLSTMSSIN